MNCCGQSIRFDCKSNDRNLIVLDTMHDKQVNGFFSSSVKFIDVDILNGGKWVLDSLSTRKNVWIELGTEQLKEFPGITACV